jgi:hypothetical protein
MRSRVATALRSGATRRPRAAAARRPGTSRRRSCPAGAPRGAQRRAAGEHAEVAAGRGLEPHLRRVGQQLGHVVHRRARRQRVGRPGDAEHRRAHVRQVDRVVTEIQPAVRKVVHAEELVVELAHRPPRIRVHVRDEVVDPLNLREEVAVVQVRQDRQRLSQVLVDRAELEPAPDERRRGAAEQAVERRPEHPVGDVRHAADRSEHPYLREVERAGDHRDRLDRQRLVGGQRQQRHDPAQAPAEHLHGRAAVVLADPPDRRRHDVVHPMLEPEVAIRERDVPVLEQVGPVAGLQHVLGQRAAAPQVETGRRCGQRRHQQQRQRAVRQVVVGWQVAVDSALRRLLDDPRGRAPQVGHAAAEDHVEDVGPGLRDGVRCRDQLHAKVNMLAASRSGISTCGQCPQPSYSSYAKSSRSPSASTRWRAPRWVTIRSRSPHTSRIGASIRSSSKQPCSSGSSQPADREEARRVLAPSMVAGEHAHDPAGRHRQRSAQRQRRVLHRAQRHAPAERVARDDRHLARLRRRVVDRRRGERVELRQHRPGPQPLRRREPRQVQRDRAPVVPREPVEHQPPRVCAVGEPVQQHQRRPLALELQRPRLEPRELQAMLDERLPHPAGAASGDAA